MKMHLKGLSRAVTLTELLVVMAIVTLLATIAVPVYIQRTEQARRATAQFEVRNIAEAQQQVALTHGFYVPIHTLDNLPFDDGSTTDNQDSWDEYIAPNQIFFVDAFSDLATQAAGGNQSTLSDAINGNASAEARMVFFWTGPFLNPQRVVTNGTRNDDNLSYDVVLDPWGRPYLMYSPIGIVANNDIDTLVTYDSFPSDANVARITVDNGELQDNDGGAGDLFDRWAIISYGANGVRDLTNNPGTNDIIDDIYYTFGAIANETAFTIF